MPRSTLPFVLPTTLGTGSVAYTWTFDDTLPLMIDGPENYGQNTVQSTGNFIFTDTLSPNDMLSQFAVHHNTFWREAAADEMPLIAETLSFIIGYTWYFGDFDAPIDENLLLPGYVEPGTTQAG